MYHNMGESDLFNVVVTSTDSKDPQRKHHKILVAGTYATILDATTAAKEELLREGYSTSDFDKYEINDGSENWIVQPSTVVSAKGGSNEHFNVTVHRVPNHSHIQADSGSKINRQLYHVLRTNINYAADRSEGIHKTKVMGTYPTLYDAKRRALKVLLENGTTRQDFAKYSEYAEYARGRESQFGPEVVVHATQDNGSNYLISVVESNQVAIC